MGELLWRDLQSCCRTEAGYTTLKSVTTREQGDLMPSYFLAETLKYFWLLFAPPRSGAVVSVYLASTEATMPW